MSGGKVIGRPHIAAVLKQKGYIETMDEAFEKYLSHGKPAYVKRQKLSPSKALEMIIQAKGVPVHAHPGLMGKSPQETENIIVGLIKNGLKGIEAYHSSHDEQMTKLLLHIAKKHNLLISGGSDFHGKNKDHRIDMGCVRVEYKLLERIKNCSEKVE
jgi:predicted metal-dependent phosphoesterase TrpH